MSNAVENPILNSPFKEPQGYYDFTGVEPRIVPGRRAAGFYGVPRTERVTGALASHEFFPLPLVNEIRQRVKEWREQQWPGVTVVTRDLLEHWNRPNRRPLFFAQREAVETIIWLTEASPADHQGVAVPSDEPIDSESIKKGYKALRRYCAKMATGAGKTTVMAMVAAWSILNKLANKQDVRFSDAVLVVCPNLTVKDRLLVLRPQGAGNYYEKFDLVPTGYRDLLSRGRVLVTNWHVFAVKDDTGSRGVVKKGRETDAAFVRRVLERDLGKSGEVLVLNDEAHHAYRPAPKTIDDVQMELAELPADERAEVEHFAEEATIWVGGLDRINKVRGVKMVVDLSATPFYLKGTGYKEGEPLPWVVSDFGLVDAIESGITKVPRIPVLDDSGRPDPKYFRLWKEIMDRLPASERETTLRRAKPEAVWREAQPALATLAAKWKETFEYFEKCNYPVPPALIVVTANTKLSQLIEESLKRGDIIKELAGDNTFRIDSRALAEADAEDGGTKEEAAERLRITTATVGKAAWPDGKAPDGYEGGEPPGKNIRAVVSVGMLTEGWDAQNVTQILGLRAFSSQLLCEQVVGRALRRMNYDVDPATGLLQPEYADIFGVPFEVIPVKGVRPSEPTQLPYSTLVQALPSRQDLAIEFPRIEGYVVDVRSRIKCDIDKVPALKIEPQIEPTQVVTRTKMGWTPAHSAAQTTTGAAETLTREQFYAEHRLQRTAFEIARDVTEVFAGGEVAFGDAPPPKKFQESARLLFPQVLRIVQDYLERRIETAPGAQKEEIALAKYRDSIASRLLDAIEPDTGAGEAPILPRVERFRPIGSTADVQFRTTKPCKPTWKSHISHVVLDSVEYGEGQAAWHLEQSEHVVSYAKNDRIDFEILYEWAGGTHKFRPDFLVRLKLGAGREITVIIESKGYENEQDRAKYAAAEKWVRAVNNWGKLGRWRFLVCREPQKLSTEFAQVVRSENAEAVQQLLQKAEQEVARLRAKGWTQDDFAQALKDLLLEEVL
jgi:type III restriction enzyme